VWTVRGCDCDAYMERVEWRQSRPAALLTLYTRHAESQYSADRPWDTALSGSVTFLLACHTDIPRLSR